MRIKKIKRISRTKTFSFPPEIADFITRRAASPGIKSESDYIARLVEFDRNHNTISESMRRDAEAVVA